MKGKRVNTSITSNKPIPFWGIGSLILSPLASLIVLFYASPPREKTFLHAPQIISLARLAFLVLMVSGMIGALLGIIKKEQPAWPSRFGLGLTVFLIGSILLFFWSLDD